MDPVRVGGNGDVGSIVDDEQRTRFVGNLDSQLGPTKQRAVVAVAIPQLQEIDTTFNQISYRFRKLFFATAAIDQHIQLRSCQELVAGMMRNLHLQIAADRVAAVSNLFQHRCDFRIQRLAVFLQDAQRLLRPRGRCRDNMTQIGPVVLARLLQFGPNITLDITGFQQ